MLNGAVVADTGFCQSGANEQLFEDLVHLSSSGNPMKIDNAIYKYSSVLTDYVKKLREVPQEEQPLMLENMNETLSRAWSVPRYGYDLGNSLCDVLRSNGGLDALIDNCTSSNETVQFNSAKVLEQCLTTENRDYVVENGLENVVNVAKDFTMLNDRSDGHSRVGTGILEHLFKHNEGTCSDVIRLGGLDAVVGQCRSNDDDTLKHCANALANLSLFGGSENQQEMINKSVPKWLFPLAFHQNDNIKYYACLAIASIVANGEFEAELQNTGTLQLVEKFLSGHNPSDFANSNTSIHGQNQNWLQKLVPVLQSKREEARNLAAFHFAMEARIKKDQGNIDIFQEIGAIVPLKQVARSPSKIASKYARQALKLIGEEVPPVLSLQVPLWTTNDVVEWVKQV